MKKKLLVCGTFVIVMAIVLGACGNGKPSAQVSEKVTQQTSGFLDEILDNYVAMAENDRAIQDKYQEAGRRNGNIEGMENFLGKKMEEQEALKTKITELVMGVGEQTFPVSASEALGITFSEGVLSVKGACPTIVNIKAKPSVSLSALGVYAIFIDSDNQIVFKTIGSVRDDGFINVGFHLFYRASNGKPLSAGQIKKYGSIAKLMIVTKEEYDAGYVPTVCTSAPQKTVKAQTSSNFVLTPQGVDKITLGADVKKLPKLIEGLYDKVSVKSEYNEVEDEQTTTATFTLKGKEVLTAMADDGGKIIYIGVSAKDISVKIGEAYFHVGSSVKDLLKAKGVQKDESYAAVYNGIQFNGDVNGKICDISVGSAW